MKINLAAYSNNFGPCTQARSKKKFSNSVDGRSTKLQLLMSVRRCGSSSHLYQLGFRSDCLRLSDCRHTSGSAKCKAMRWWKLSGPPKLWRSVPHFGQRETSRHRKQVCQRFSINSNQTDEHQRIRTIVVRDVIRVGCICDEPFAFFDVAPDDQRTRFG